MNVIQSRRKSKTLATPTYLAPKQISRILVAVGAKYLARERKELLFRQGSPAVSIYYVVSGSVEGSALSRQGKERTIAQYGSADFVGETGLNPPAPLLGLRSRQVQLHTSVSWY